MRASEAPIAAAMLGSLQREGRATAESTAKATAKTGPRQRPESLAISGPRALEFLPYGAWRRGRCVEDDGVQADAGGRPIFRWESASRSAQQQRYRRLARQVRLVLAAHRTAVRPVHHEAPAGIRPVLVDPAVAVLRIERDAPAVGAMRHHPHAAREQLGQVLGDVDRKS